MGALSKKINIFDWNLKHLRANGLKIRKQLEVASKIEMNSISLNLSLNEVFSQSLQFWYLINIQLFFVLF